MRKLRGGGGGTIESQQQQQQHAPCGYDEGERGLGGCSACAECKRLAEHPRREVEVVWDDVSDQVAWDDSASDDASHRIAARVVQLFLQSVRKTTMYVPDDVEQDVANFVNVASRMPRQVFLLSWYVSLRRGGQLTSRFFYAGCASSRSGWGVTGTAGRGAAASAPPTGRGTAARSGAWRSSRSTRGVESTSTSSGACATTRPAPRWWGRL
jgi:hypothetical protein